MKKICIEKDHVIHEVDNDKNGLVEQMSPLKCVKAFKLCGDDINIISNWKKDNGIYAIGNIIDIEKAFNKLFDSIKSCIDKEIVNGLEQEETLDYLTMFTSQKQDIAIIIGGGHY